MDSETSLELTGDNAVQDAITLLQPISQDTAEKRVEIVITPVNEESEVEANNTSENEGGDEKERYKGKIQPNTSHHVTLHAISQLDEDRMVSGTEITEFIDGYDSGSVRPALTQLYERMLVEREQVSGPNPYYKYCVSDHGMEVLDELGEPME